MRRIKDQERQCMHIARTSMVLGILWVTCCAQYIWDPPVLVLGNSTLPSENEAICNFYQDSLGLKKLFSEENKFFFSYRYRVLFGNFGFFPSFPLFFTSNVLRKTAYEKNPFMWMLLNPKEGVWRNILCTYLWLCVGFLNSTASALAVVMLHRYKPVYVQKKCFSLKSLNLRSRRKSILKLKINREHWLFNCIDTKAKCCRFWSGQIQRV